MKRKPESGSGKNAKGTNTGTPKSLSATVKPTQAQDIPGKIVPSKLADYLEIITIAVFQAGTSWAMVRNKWPNFRKAFAEFDPTAVSKFDQTDIDRLMQDTGILRSEKKIRGTIDNASALLALDSKYGSFQSYLRSFDGYDQLSVDLQKRFKYLGEMSVYYFLFRVSEQVPPFEPWILTIEGDHPRMREMVEKAAAEDTR